MIRTFLFDLGNVLAGFSHIRMCNQVAQLTGRSTSVVQEVLFDGGLLHAFERGQLTEADFREKLEHTFGRPLDRQELRNAFSDIFELNISMVSVVGELKSRGHRLVLLSNTSISHFEFVWDRFEILQLFDDFVTSYTVGALKPEPAIFEAALAAIQCPPAECFYTDDIADYVIAARTFGLQAEVFSDTQTLIQQLRSRDVNLQMSD